MHAYRRDTINGGLVFEKTTKDTDEILNPKPGRPPKQSLKASRFIAEMFLGRDEVPSTEIEARGKMLGISIGTLNKVKKEEGYGTGYGKKKHEDDPDYHVWKRP